MKCSHVIHHVFGGGWLLKKKCKTLPRVFSLQTYETTPKANITKASNLSIYSKMCNKNLAVSNALRLCWSRRTREVFFHDMLLSYCTVNKFTSNYKWCLLITDVLYRCMWLVSCECHQLERLAYTSDVDPVSSEAIWALGAGCRYITTFIIPPARRKQVWVKTFIYWNISRRRSFAKA